MWYQQCWCLQQKLPPEEPVEGAEVSRELMSVQEQQENMMDKLNLDGLSEWSPRNAATARELLFSYHNIFALKPNELGLYQCHRHMRFASTMMNLSKNVLGTYLCLC